MNSYVKCDFYCKAILRNKKFISEHPEFLHGLQNINLKWLESNFQNAAFDLKSIKIK